jgi:hypothetical protein
MLILTTGQRAIYKKVPVFFNQVFYFFSQFREAYYGSFNKYKKINGNEKKR